MSEPMIKLTNVSKWYGPVQVLNNVNGHVDKGDVVVICGPSGSGKSTLMHILGCLDVPSHGTYLLGGTDVSHMSEAQLAQVRNKQIGFVFQQFNLLPSMTALRNVELPLVYAGVPASERRARATEALERVGLGERTDHRPGELSGGQQQRVSVARALVTDPTLILADEPTGNLDSRSATEIGELLREISAAYGRSVLMVTHDPRIAGFAERLVLMRDGRIIDDLDLDDAPEGPRLALERAGLL